MLRSSGMKSAVNLKIILDSSSFCLIPSQYVTKFHEAYSLVSLKPTPFSPFPLLRLIQPRSTMSYLNYGSGFLPFYGAVSWLALDTPVHSPSSRWTDYQHLNCRYDSALYLLESLLLFFLSFQEKSRAFNMCWKAL